jgi:hypothetical protein
VFAARLAGGGLASFRALDPDDDLDLVHGWMHQPHVVPFWRLDLDRADLAAYLRRAAADDHQQVLIGSVDGEPVSYWECYWAGAGGVAESPINAWCTPAASLRATVEWERWTVTSRPVWRRPRRRSVRAAFE